MYLKLAAETRKNTKKLVITIACSKYGYNAFEAKAYCNSNSKSKRTAPQKDTATAQKKQLS